MEFKEIEEWMKTADEVQDPTNGRHSGYGGIRAYGDEQPRLEAFGTRSGSNTLTWSAKFPLI